MSHDRHFVFLAQRPNGVIATIVIRNLVAPARRNHYRTETVLLRPLNFGKSIFNWSGDRNQSDATATLWVC
ncbi:unannotated protein [freshwater metagenome]|uniref:Unannotated protein n=1 Tax=freshwater metagenome TaxID=449393 RepID=A0A6J6E556_9ZZZZ